MKQILSLLLISSLLNSGCATLFSSKSESVNFSSDPEKSKVYVDGQYMGTTPIQLKLTSTTTHATEFRKEGYESKTVLINNKVGGGWVVLDIFPGILLGFIPLLIDAVTGDWKSLDQNNLKAALEEKSK